MESTSNCVNHGAYLPFCFLALITPLVSLFYGITGLTMTKNEESKKIEKKVAKKLVEIEV